MSAPTIWIVHEDGIKDIRAIPAVAQEGFGQQGMLSGWKEEALAREAGIR